MASDRLPTPRKTARDFDREIEELGGATRDLVQCLASFARSLSAFLDGAAVTVHLYEEEGDEFTRHGSTVHERGEECPPLPGGRAVQGLALAERRMDRLSAINEFGVVLVSALTPDEVPALATAMTSFIMGTEGCILRLRDEQGAGSAVRDAHGLRDEASNREILKLEAQAARQQPSGAGEPLQVRFSHATYPDDGADGEQGARPPRAGDALPPGPALIGLRGRARRRTGHPAAARVALAGSPLEGSAPVVGEQPGQPFDIATSPRG